MQYIYVHSITSQLCSFELRIIAIQLAAVNIAYNFTILAAGVWRRKSCAVHSKLTRFYSICSQLTISIAIECQPTKSYQAKNNQINVSYQYQYKRVSTQHGLPPDSQYFCCKVCIIIIAYKHACKFYNVHMMWQNTWIT